MCVFETPYGGDDNDVDDEDDMNIARRENVKTKRGSKGRKEVGLELKRLMMEPNRMLELLAETS
ncbi:hypothetical protein ACLOJK_027006 [Asimina triloba]